MRRFALKNRFCQTLIILCALAWIMTPAIASSDDITTHQVKCFDDFVKDKGKCDQFFEQSMEAPDQKTEAKLFNRAVKCRADAQEDLDVCRDERLLKIFVKNKAWRKNNAKALSKLSKEFENSDDKCKVTAAAGIEKCEGQNSKKKKQKCLVNIDKKEARCMRNSEKAFLAGFKKLKPPSEVLEDGGLEKVKRCHIKLRDKLRGCQNRKCINKYQKAFQRCVKRETKGVAFRKGSNSKKLAASIQKVIDAGKPLYKVCSDKAGKFEKEAVAKAKKRGTLQNDKDQIKEKAEAKKQKCYDYWQRTQKKAMEAQIRQHFPR